MKLTVEGLQEIRKKAAKELAIREGKPRAKITVHMGDCGIAAGARGVMEALLSELAEVDRPDIQVMAGSCLERCSFEPIVTVEIDGTSITRYQKMDPEKIRQVVQKHVLEGHVQSNFVLPPA